MMAVLYPNFASDQRGKITPLKPPRTKKALKVAKFTRMKEGLRKSRPTSPRDTLSPVATGSFPGRRKSMRTRPEPAAKA